MHRNLAARKIKDGKVLPKIKKLRYQALKEMTYEYYGMEKYFEYSSQVNT